jgi:hypothetical protein
MPFLVEVNMKISGIMAQPDEHRIMVQPHHEVRFLKTMTLPAVPKVGTVIDAPVKPDFTLPCRVTRVEWSEPRDMFVVSYRYAKKK